MVKSEQYRVLIDGGFTSVTLIALVAALYTLHVRQNIYEAVLLFGVLHNTMTNTLIWIMSRGVTLATAALESKYGHLLKD